MGPFKVLLVIVFIFLLIAIAIPVNTVGIPPTGLDYRDCGNHVYARPSDSLNSIAARCGTTLSALLAANPNLPTNGDQLLGFGTRVLMPPRPVVVVAAPTTGPQTIVINPPSAVPASSVPITGGAVYTVRPGDTLFGIAQQHSTTVSTMLQLNPSITDPNRIYAGQVLITP